MNEALMVAIPAAEIIIIKRDFDLLRKLIPSLTDDVQMQMVPYTALFCYEAISYLQKHDPSIIIEQESRYSIKDVRQKAKFFELGINKLIRSIDNVDAMQNEYFISLMKYPELGYWNLHTNLGIYYDAQKHIVGNTHYTSLGIEMVNMSYSVLVITTALAALRHSRSWIPGLDIHFIYSLY